MKISFQVLNTFDCRTPKPPSTLSPLIAGVTTSSNCPLLATAAGTSHRAAADGGAAAGTSAAGDDEAAGEDEGDDEDDSVECVRFSATHPYLAAASLSGRLTVWDLTTQTTRFTFTHDVSQRFLISFPREISHLF